MAIRRFFDLETTGLISAGICPQIIQYAFITWDDGKLVDLRARFVQPLIAVEAKAAECNGYTPEYWAEHGATPLCEADVQLFFQLMHKQAVGGHNILGFDLPVLKAECNRLGYAAPEHDYHVIDTMCYSQILKDLGLVQSASLAPVAEYLGLVAELPAFAYARHNKPHDAVFDAGLSAQLYSEMIVRTAEGFQR
jgi:DNA polymerase III epsilon subunit-like protein